MAARIFQSGTVEEIILVPRIQLKSAMLEFIWDTWAEHLASLIGRRSFGSFGVFKHKNVLLACVLPFFRDVVTIWASVTRDFVGSV